MSQTQPPDKQQASALARSRGLLSDRGLDPDRLIGRDVRGQDVTAAGFHVMLGVVAASEKAGQSPTHALARLALASGLPSEVADALFLAYNQQSAEEAGHGDKVFGNAYYALGGCAPEAAQSVVGDPGDTFLRPEPDPSRNEQRLSEVAAAIGGLEIVALQSVIPDIVMLAERWAHPALRELNVQIRDSVRPEESRHVLTWRYVFHQLVAPKGPDAITRFMQATNAGRRIVGAGDLDREAFLRSLGSSSPSPRQLLGKERGAPS